MILSENHVIKRAHEIEMLIRHVILVRMFIGEILSWKMAIYLYTYYKVDGNKLEVAPRAPKTGE